MMGFALVSVAAGVSRAVRGVAAIMAIVADVTDDRERTGRGALALSHADIECIAAVL